MSKALGSVATVEVSPDSSTWTKVGFCKKASFQFAITAVDTTDNDDNGYKSSLPGDFIIKGTATFNYNPSDAGQAALLGYATGKTQVYIRYRGRGAGTGLPQEFGLVTIEKFYFDSEHEKVQEMMLEVSSTGSWTVGNQ